MNCFVGTLFGQFHYLPDRRVIGDQTRDRIDASGAAQPKGTNLTIFMIFKCRLLEDALQNKYRFTE